MNDGNYSGYEIHGGKKCTDYSPYNSCMALALLRGSSQLEPSPTYCTVSVLWSLIIYEILERGVQTLKLRFFYHIFVLVI